MTTIQPEQVDTTVAAGPKLRLRHIALRFLVTLAIVTTLFALAWSR